MSISTKYQKNIYILLLAIRINEQINLLIFINQLQLRNHQKISTTKMAILSFMLI